MILYRIGFAVPSFVDVDAETPDEAVEKAIDWLNEKDVTPIGYLQFPEVIARSQ